MIEIFGRKTSSNVQIVMWGLAELGLEHVRHDYGGAFGGTDTPEFRAMNPNGVVPVLRDGAVTVFESGAVLRYLAARYGDEHFWPQDPGTRAGLDQWADWAKVTLNPPVIQVFLQLIRTKAAERNQALLATQLANTQKLMAMADARIGAGPWLNGERICWADCVMWHLLYRYYTLEIERKPTPNLDALYARLVARPAFAEHVMVSYDSLRVE